jgi:hypothetical protein
MDCAIRPTLISRWPDADGPLVCCKRYNGKRGEASTGRTDHEHEFNCSQISDRGRLVRTRAARTRRRRYAGQPRQGRAAQTRQARRQGNLLFAGAYARRQGQAAVLHRYRHGENGEPYLSDFGGGFKPYRHDVAWAKAEEAPIGRLLQKLEFTASKPNWGYQLRFGLFSISAADFRLIAQAMKAATQSCELSFRPPGLLARCAASIRPARDRAECRAPDNARRRLPSVWRGRKRARCF